MNKNNNIAIVGGGTAGWLTALFVKKKYPNKTITLIESKDIGILGAGEGTTPYIYDILSFIDIPFIDLLKNCQATLKVGLKYVNWSKTNPVYYHTFENLYPILKTYKQCDIQEFFTENYRAKKLPVLESLTAQCCEKNLVPVIKDGETIFDYQPLAPTAIHFDARLLAEYLKNIGLSRGIIRKEGTINQIKNDENGCIKSLVLKDTTEVELDFVFDCTGFRRLIIGEHYKSEWVSLSKMLPAKRALAFFLEQKNDIPPYTGVLASNYGWIWQIPLQHRYGCGYVFDSNFITDDQAKEEIDQVVGKPVDIVNTFKFDPGYYTDIWIKNCIGIGLSTGFLEPLEATSIHQLGRNLIDFFSYENLIDEKDQKIRNDFNKKYILETKQIADFIYLHYITDKDTTDFWTNFTKNNSIPDSIKEILEINQYRMIQPLDLAGQLIFNVDNYLSILSGNNQLSQTAIDRSLQRIPNKQKEYYNYLLQNDELLKQFLKHNDFLKIKDLINKTDE